MIKTISIFRYKKGTEGIDFGEEWYKRLMTQLQSTSDVVCLFTERASTGPGYCLRRGVAKGEVEHSSPWGSFGVPLSRVSAGPFYQFMNMDDSEADLTKLVKQLARRVPNLELDGDVVQSQVSTFKSTEAALLEKLGAGKRQGRDEE